MARFPYILVIQTTLAASASGSPSYQLPQGEKLEISDIEFQSTGAFSLTDIRDSDGQHYTNASVSTPIPSVVLQNGANANIGIKTFKEPLVIDGGVMLIIDVKDTSAAPNVVNLVMNCMRSNGI